MPTFSLLLVPHICASFACQFTKLKKYTSWFIIKWVWKMQTNNHESKSTCKLFSLIFWWMQLLFIYFMWIENTWNWKKKNCGIFGNVQIIYNGCFEVTLNGSLHIHVLLWNENAPNANEFKCATIERWKKKSKMVY